MEQEQDKYQMETYKNRKYNKLKKHLENTSKTIPIAFLITSLSGGFQLLSFSRYHKINAIDFINSGVIFSFGAFYLFYYTIFLGLCLSMSFFHASQNDFLYSTLINKSKFNTIKNHHLLSQSIFSVILSLWPLAIMVSYSFSWSLLSILLLVFLALFCYHNFGTTDVAGTKLFNFIRFKAILPTSTSIFGCMALLIILLGTTESIKHIFKEISDIALTLALILISFLICFFSFTPPSATARVSFPFAIYILPAVFLMVFILPNPASQYTPNNIIKSLGIGLQKRCYLINDTDKKLIPENLKRTYGPIIELNVTVNIGDIYYLSRFDDADMVSVFRFTAHNYNQIACPISQTNLDTHYL